MVLIFSKIINMSRKNNWVKKRHNRIRHLVAKPVYRILHKKYGFTYTPFDTQGKPYLVLANHQTAMDQFMVQFPFDDYCYPIASEDIFSISLGKLLSWAVAPIPITKGQINIKTILTCKQIAKQNKSILVHVEGNRTYSGKTEYISPAVAKLAKVLKLPLAFLLIRGGYGVRPRWSEKTRTGKTHASVESVLEPEDFLAMSDEQLYEEITKRLYVDESSDDGQLYECKGLAEYLERAIYYCPNCGVTHFLSSGNSFKCTTCGLEVLYQPNKQFAMRDGSTPPYRNVNEWYEAQKEFVRQYEPSIEGKEIARDYAKISKVLLLKKKKKICKKAEIILFDNGIKIVSKKYNWTKNFSEDITSMAVLGKNKLNVIFADGETLQFEGDVHFNALKYANFLFRHKNYKEGNNATSQFLGL